MVNGPARGSSSAAAVTATPLCPLTFNPTAEGRSRREREKKNNSGGDPSVLAVPLLYLSDAFATPLFVSAPEAAL